MSPDCQAMAINLAPPCPFPSLHLKALSYPNSKHNAFQASVEHILDLLEKQDMKVLRDGGLHVRLVQSSVYLAVMHLAGSV